SLGMLPEELLTTALNAQMLIREGTVSKEEGIEGIRAASKRRLLVESALNKQGLLRRASSRTTIRLGQLLVEAGALKDEELWPALTSVLKTRLPLGQVLCQMNLLKQAALTQTLKLQEMVANQTLSPAQAASTLKTVMLEGVPLAKAVAYVEVPESTRKTTVRFHDLLLVAGLIKSQIIDQLK